MAETIFTAATKASVAFSEAISAALRELLEQKHLYQKVRVTPDAFVRQIEKRLSNGGMTAAAAEIFQKLVDLPWEPLGAHDVWPAVAEHEAPRYIGFRVLHTKLVCSECESREAFNPIDAGSIRDSMLTLPGTVTTPRTVQNFALPFLCQACRKFPEAFLVRRDNYQMWLCGRSPIEMVEVPKDIPVDVRSFFSGAVVAQQSGQVLSGNFMLRTLIEQFARAVVPNSEGLKADQLIEAYMAMLPPGFKTQFFSVKELYGLLSADIHSAKGDMALFETTKEKIIEHFEARRLFKL